MQKSVVEAHGLTVEVLQKLCNLSPGEASGIPGVAVKCVDTGRNTGGGGDWLVWD